MTAAMQDLRGEATVQIDRIRRSGLLIAPGVLDAGLASLAGFSGSLYATRFLPAEVLGVYALLFTGFVFAGLIAPTLLFAPAHVESLSVERRDRIAILSRTLRYGPFLTVIAAIPTAFIALLAAGDIDDAVILRLALTATALTALSPLQDHVRSTFHLSDRSWHAASISIVQLTSAVSLLLALHFAAAPRELIPFGAVAGANAISLVFGVVLARLSMAGAVCPLPPLRELLRSGRTLLGASLLPALALLGATALVAVLASLEELGQAEAARVIAMPISVLASGISEIVRPDLLEAGRSGSRRRWIRGRNVYLGAAGGLGLLYLAYASWSHPLNAMEALVPAAYIVGGLVLARTAAQLVRWSPHTYSIVLLGAKQNRDLLKIALITAPVLIAVAAATAPLIGPFALPAATFGAAAVRLYFIRRRTARILTQP